jgi:hypothetical protein
MQKWQKNLLIILIILAILGVLLGFAITNSEIGQVKFLANIDILGFLELALLLISIICGTLDIYEIYYSRSQLGTAKFNLILTTSNRLRNLLIFFVVIIILELIVFINSFDMHILPLCFITLILILLIIFHNKFDNGINENGILYFGIFHSLDDIESYNIEDELLLEMNIVVDFFWFKYNNLVKFNFDEKDKDGIEVFLEEKL